MPRANFVVPANWQLPDALRRRVGTTVGRQRVMEHDGHMLIVAHQVPEQNEIHRRGVLFWRDVEGNWKASSGDSGVPALASLVQQYTKRIEEFDRLETSAQRSSEYIPLLEGLSPILRASRNVYTVLQEARKSELDCRELIDVRDAAYEMSRNAELLYQDAKNSMEIAVVRRAEEQAAASQQMTVAAHRLNLMAALFLPLATLSGVFGTCFTEGWSWSETAGPFTLFLLVGLLGGLILAAFVTRVHNQP